jgi:thiol-disulfide isomerase/thioredoxin
MKKIITICCFALLMGCSSSSSKNSSSNDLATNQKKSIYIDLDNNEVNLSSFKGKKVLINYWATWCAPCIQKMPSLVKVQEQLQSEFVFLLVSDESIQRISRFKNRKSFNLKYLKSTVSLASLGVYSLPTTYIYNKEGKQIKTIVGSVDWESTEMIKQLKAL